LPKRMQDRDEEASQMNCMKQWKMMHHLWSLRFRLGIPSCRVSFAFAPALPAALDNGNFLIWFITSWNMFFILQILQFVCCCQDSIPFAQLFWQIRCDALLFAFGTVVWVRLPRPWILKSLRWMLMVLVSTLLELAMPSLICEDEAAKCLSSAG
jgi:hypothetical protein